MRHPITQPMLAAKIEHPEDIPFPVLATPKLDGVRGLKVNGKALARKMTPIRNNFIRRWIERNIPDGCDMEITTSEDFNQTSGDVRSIKGCPDFTLSIFDYVDKSLDEPYLFRMKKLSKLPLDLGRVQKILPVRIGDHTELIKYEDRMLDLGFEGVMLRTYNSPYKCGRSTEREGWLLKLKRFEDSEAWIIGFIEARENLNGKTLDNIGLAKRSTHAENMVAKGTLGALVCRDIYSGVKFNLSGFTQELAQDIWDNLTKYLHEIVKYSYQKYGMKDKPRQPKFKGFRDLDDI